MAGDHFSAGLLLELNDFMVENVAGGHRATRRIDDEQHGADVFVLFRFFELGDDLLHHTRFFADKSALDIVGYFSFDGNEQNFTLCTALQGVLLQRFAVVAENTDPGGGTAGDGHHQHQQEDYGV